MAVLGDELDAVVLERGDAIQVTPRARLPGDGCFARFRSRSTGAIVTVRMDTAQYEAERASGKGTPVPREMGREEEWEWVISWRGAVFDTASGLLEQRGDFFPGDEELCAQYIVDDGYSQPFRREHVTLEGTTLRVSESASDPVVMRVK